MLGWLRATGLTIRVTVPLALKMPPPSASVPSARLLVTRLWVRSTVPEPVSKMPPPREFVPLVVLPATGVSVSFTVPEVSKRPPPCAWNGSVKRAV